MSKSNVIRKRTFVGMVCTLLTFLSVAAYAATRVIVEDYESDKTLPKVWVVGFPSENATVKLSREHPFHGEKCLDLHYHFTGGGQYMGITQTVNIQAPIHHVHFMLYGDGSGIGYGLYVSDVSGETHKYRDASTMKVDWKGWKAIDFDIDVPHEHFGGDNNGKIDYPISALTFEISHGEGPAAEDDIFFDAVSVDSEKSAFETLGSRISIDSPAYCSDVKGDTRIALSAPGFTTVVAKCWKQGGQFGSDSTIATVSLDSKGAGSFVFPANSYPHGPITITLTGVNGSLKDNCYLQLYNRGGVSWNEGLPKAPPSAAGMKLLFADDFGGPLSISSNDPKSVYFDHKPGGGDFSTLPFTGHNEPNNPFSQVDTYLRIRADANKNSAGLIASVKNDATGIKASAPCYFECRFIGPNAIGTWPAFWLLTDWTDASGTNNHNGPVDELDIIEAYGGEGPHEPNSFDLYRVTPHAWNQGDAGKVAETQAQDALHNPIAMKKFGIPSTWYEAMHTYGCKITDTETIYYCDNIEVGRHKTLETSKKQPFFFLINLATGGGWPVDLSRYGGLADMYVDFVRVYQGTR